MNDSPVSNPPTVDDALRALDLIEKYDFRVVGAEIPNALAPIRQFLTRLVKMGEPEGVITSDTEGYIIEGAFQRGFEMIDDNGDLLVVHANDLIKYVTELRAGAATFALQKATRESLPPVVLSAQDDVTLGRLVLEFGNTPLFGEGRVRKDVLNDLRKLMGISRAAEPPVPRWTSTKDKPLPLGLNVKAWDAPSGYRPMVWAGQHTDSPKTAQCDWFIALPDLPTLEEREQMGLGTAGFFDEFKQEPPKVQAAIGQIAANMSVPVKATKQERQDADGNKSS